MGEPNKKINWHDSASEDRWISLADGTAKLPEPLLLAHGQGKVLFVTGAGISMPSRLPNFRDLVVKTYASLDNEVYQVLSAIPADICNRWAPSTGGLSNDGQRAEVRRFIQGEYDVVLGMLERRMDRPGTKTSRVRTEIAKLPPVSDYLSPR